MKTYKTTSYSDAKHKQKQTQGEIEITWHNGLKWYIVSWSEKGGN